MKPIWTPDCNFTYHLAGGTSENDLPCLRDMENQTVTSFWQIEADEVADLPRVTGVGFKVEWTPMVIVEAGWALEELITVPLEVVMGRNHNVGAAGIAVDDYWRAHLAEDKTFVLRIHRIPTPPVALWLVTP